MKLFIKNMVCPRCIMVVRQVFQKMKVDPLAVQLGTVVLQNSLSEAQTAHLSRELLQLGFELLHDPRTQLVETIKILLIEKLRDEKIEEGFSIKKYLSSRINKDYSFLSKLFSSATGMTIEYYFICLKIEKVKELLTYKQYTLQELAQRLGYSSVQHLSGQFKKVAGVTASAFKNDLTPPRKSMDQVGGAPVGE